MAIICTIVWHWHMLTASVTGHILFHCNIGKILCHYNFSVTPYHSKTISLLRVTFDLIWYTELNSLKRNTTVGALQTKTLLLYLVIRGKIVHSNQHLGIDRFLCDLCIHY